VCHIRSTYESRRQFPRLGTGDDEGEVCLDQSAVRVLFDHPLKPFGVLGEGGFTSFDCGDHRVRVSPAAELDSQEASSLVGALGTICLRLKSSGEVVFNKVGGE